MDITDLGELPDRPRKSAFEKLQEEMQRQLGPLRQIQEIQDLVNRYSPEYQMRDLLKQFEPGRQLQEILDRTSVAKQVQELLDSTSLASHAQKMVEQYFPKNAFSAHGLDKLGLAARAYETYLPMEAAKKSMDSLLGSFKDLDSSVFEYAGEDVPKEAREAAESISQAAAAEPTLQGAVDQIITAIQAQQNPAVQVMLLFFFKKLLDYLFAGAIGAVMGYYAPVVLGASPQAATKSVKEIAREAVGAPDLLTDYRYVTANVLIVRQNARARSPEIARLQFSRPVRLLKKEMDFALVVWTDKESGAEIQGWVFARYLGKFN